ncbi:RNA-directed DNA polymerase from mobile element jockey [Eumeta japonica]|uniref:RNA-directed DNA polymerase from mobile element jockey n=1 Tax=Eumeta variegata TaxID=151549 RepID=A0A4C1VTT4_EUMVA|nr:RNA-directed DNA polymerase from mobile element jockey [Eumeta japonica]
MQVTNRHAVIAVKNILQIMAGVRERPNRVKLKESYLSVMIQQNIQFQQEKVQLAAKNTIRRECPKPTSVPRSAGTAVSTLEENISTIMSILQVVRSEVSDLEAKFQKAKHGVDHLKIILDNQDLINSSVELAKYALKYKADIIMVQETHLKPHFSNSCKISNFILLRIDRQGAQKGGKAIYYNRALYCCPIDTPPLINIEATACRLSMIGHGILILVSVYLTPKKELLRSDLEAPFALGGAVIFFGNFNSKSTNWKCNCSNRNGREMEALAKSLHFNIVVGDRYFSLLMSANNALDYKTVVDSSSRIVPAKSDRKELPGDVIELIRDKNGALRREGKYPTCKNRSRARAHQRKVKARIKEVRTDNWSELMSEISPSHKAYWGLVKALKTEGAVLTPALKRRNNFIAFDDREIAECLADSIEHQCSDNPPYDFEDVRRVEEDVCHRVSLPPKDDLDPITHDEVSKHITGLKIRKAPGRNTISIKALKCFSAPLVALLVAIFNTCIQNCYFRTALKEAVVIGIPKAGETTRPPRQL